MRRRRGGHRVSPADAAEALSDEDATIGGRGSATAQDEEKPTNKRGRLQVNLESYSHDPLYQRYDNSDATVDSVSRGAARMPLYSTCYIPVGFRVNGRLLRRVIQWRKTSKREVFSSSVITQV